MKNLNKLLIVVGIILILAAIVVRVGMIPIIVSGRSIKPSSMLIVANTAFLLALLTKK
jgi:hypothetical protein